MQEKEELQPAFTDRVSYHSYTPEKHTQQNRHLFLGNGFLHFPAPDWSTYNPIFLNRLYQTTTQDKQLSPSYIESKTTFTLPCTLSLKAYLPKQELTLDSPFLTHYYKELLFTDGRLNQIVEWKLPQGTLSIESTFMLSFEKTHLFYMQHEATWKGTPKQPIMIELGIEHNLDLPTQNKTNLIAKHYTTQGNNQIIYTGKTNESPLAFALGMHTASISDSEITKHVKIKQEKETSVNIRFQMNQGGEKLKIYQAIAVNCEEQTKQGSPLQKVQRSLEEIQVKNIQFNKRLQEQKKHLSHFWKKHDIFITGDVKAQQVYRYNAYMLKQTAPTTETNLTFTPADHPYWEKTTYDWQMDTIVLPYYIYTQPSIARAILLARCQILPQAKKQAQQMNKEGALFLLNPNEKETDTLQLVINKTKYYVNANLVYNIKKYIAATNDVPFLLSYAAEVLFETARFWLSMGTFIENKGFCINSVTGPNEYAVLVNNNFYTNSMVKDALFYSVETCKQLQTQHPQTLKELANKINLQEQEITLWNQAATQIYLPYDSALAIYKQDDSFLEKSTWDKKQSPQENNIYLYRHQIIQQPDAVLADFLQGYHISTADRARNLEYYETITTNDSVATPIIHAIEATKYNQHKKAFTYFEQATNVQANPLQAAGYWLAIVYGFAGFQDHYGIFSFAPKLPKKWETCSFCLSLHGGVLQLDLAQNKVTYTILEGENITFSHFQQNICLQKQQSISFSLAPTIRAIIFKLDQVITNTDSIRYLAWKLVCESMNLAFTKQDYLLLNTKNNQEILQAILQKNQVYWEEELCQLIYEKQKVYYKNNLAQIRKNNLNASIFDVLTQIKQKNYKLILAANHKEDSYVLEQLAIKHLFDYITPPSHLNPNRTLLDTYLDITKQLNLQPEDCVCIGTTKQETETAQSLSMFSVNIGQVDIQSNLYLPNVNDLTLEAIESQYQDYHTH